MENKTWSVAALGLTNMEMMLLRSLTGLTSGRDGDRYAVVDIFDRCNILIINADDREMLDKSRTLAGNGSPSATIFFSAMPPANPDQHYLLRPFSPAKLLVLLDRVVNELREVEPIWAGLTHLPSIAASVSNTAMRALVIDDSPTVCKQIELELRNFNIQADVAETGERGLELLQSKNYNIIFLDVVLPGTDGYQVCKEIRKNPNSRETPVIMLTSKSSPFDKVRGMLSGCSAYLTKPVDYTKFRDAIEKHADIIRAAA